MPIFKQRLSKKTKIQIILVAIAIFILTALVIADVIFGGPITTLLTNKDKIVSFIASLGILAPIVFGFLSIVETVVAPIPGQIIGLAGGYIFGWWGLPINFISSAIGCFIVFYLSRRFGRPLAEKMIKKSSLDKFDHLTKEKGSLVFFLIFLIPGLPNDVICYIAGLTEIPIKRLMALVLLGRLPSMIMINFIGAGIGESSLMPVFITTIITVILLAFIVIRRDKILDIISKPKNPTK